MKKQTVNETEFVFPSFSENERFARLAVSGFISQLDPEINELSDIKTAVSEGVTNSIVHGYKNTIGKIYISMKIFDDREVMIKIRDKGCGIHDIEMAMQPLFTTAPDEERAGLGFAVMESMMDSIKVSSHEGKGTTLTLRKKIGTKGKADT